MTQFELTPDVFTVDAVGEPGKRTFYIQASAGGTLHTFLLEKQQVTLLAEKLREMMLAIDRDDTLRSTIPERDPGMALSEPVEPTWRVGTIGLAYDEDDDTIILYIAPVSEDDEEEETDADEDENGVRLLLRREQVRTFVLHALGVVGEGRPLCQLCGLPMDPNGHKCPASNGHQLTVV